MMMMMIIHHTCSIDINDNTNDETNTTTTTTSTTTTTTTYNNDNNNNNNTNDNNNRKSSKGGLVKAAIRILFSNRPVNLGMRFANSPHFWHHQQNTCFSFAFHSRIHLTSFAFHSQIHPTPPSAKPPFDYLSYNTVTSRPLYNPVVTPFNQDLVKPCSNPINFTLSWKLVGHHRKVTLTIARL